MQSNQFFNLPSSSHLIKEIDTIYYTVGLPILVQEYNSNPRKYIPNSEIVESFTLEKIAEKKLRLFKTEDEALHYAHVLRSGLGFGGGMKPLIDDITQPAIFKVDYLGEKPLIDSIMIEEVMMIPTNCYVVVPQKIYMTVKYHEVNRSDVFPLEAYLKLLDCHANKMHSYPVYSYSDQVSRCKFL